MSENLIYADLNLTESTKPRLKITDIKDTTYAEVKVQSLDTNTAASYTSSGKSCCSRTRATVLVAVIILLLVVVVCLILMCKSCEKVTPGLVLATETGRDPRQWSGESYKQNHTDCPQGWEEKEGKCYFFSKMSEVKDLDTFRKECKDRQSDLVIIENKQELDYLASKSNGHYYLIGLKYDQREGKWKWINDKEHNQDVFPVSRSYSDYLCYVIGNGKVQSAPCDGSSTTKNMCEKAANISQRQKES